MFSILAILLSPALIGLPLAAWAYPWRKPAFWPYAGFVGALAAPLLILLLLQAMFTLPAGTCSDRALSELPPLVGLASVAVAIALLVKARDHRRFIGGIAIAVCPPTLLWSVVAAMSLSGCWI